MDIFGLTPYQLLVILIIIVIAAFIIIKLDPARMILENLIIYGSARDHSHATSMNVSSALSRLQHIDIGKKGRDPQYKKSVEILRNYKRHKENEINIAIAYINNL